MTEKGVEAMHSQEFGITLIFIGGVILGIAFEKAMEIFRSE